MRVVDEREGMVRILITGLKAYGYHGCTPREREEGQVFLVDVELEYEASAAVRDDELSLAVDYDRVAQGIRDIVAGEPFRLIESLAAEIGRYVMAGTAATQVLVRVHKPEAPLGCEVRDVAVEMAFRRGGEKEGPSPLVDE
ncbi:MAG: dihydroneopterin aldolase [Actinomycetota bacterium]